MRGPLIVLEGNIGVGKTSFAKMLAERLDLTPFYEPVETNPYLEPFYAEEKRGTRPNPYALPMQFRLLFMRHAIQKAASWHCMAGGSGAVIDRSIHGDAVFARLHKDAGNIDELGWDTYLYALDLMTLDMLVPRLVIYLDAPPEDCHARVNARARGAEDGIPLDYLRKIKAGHDWLFEQMDRGSHHWASIATKRLRIDWSGDVPWLTRSDTLDQIRAALK